MPGGAWRTPHTGLGVLRAIEAMRARTSSSLGSSSFDLAPTTESRNRALYRLRIAAAATRSTSAIFGVIGKSIILFRFVKRTFILSFSCRSVRCDSRTERIAPLFPLGIRGCGKPVWWMSQPDSGCRSTILPRSSSLRLKGTALPLHVASWRAMLSQPDGQYGLSRKCRRRRIENHATPSVAVRVGRWCMRTLKPTASPMLGITKNVHNSI